MAKQSNKIRKTKKPARYAYELLEADLQVRPPVYPFTPRLGRMYLPEFEPDGFDWTPLPDRE